MKNKISVTDKSFRLITKGIYPLPTYRLFIYLAVWFGVCTFSAIRVNTPTAIISLIMLAVLGTSVFYGLLCFLFLEAELKYAYPNIRKGEKTFLVLEIKNLSFIPLPRLKAAMLLPKADKDGFAHTREKKKKRVGVTLGGFRSVTAKQAVSFGSAGYFYGECERISVYDPLGLIKFVCPARLAAGVAVTPVEGIQTEATKVFTGFGSEVDRTRKGEDRDEVFEISDYVIGDSLKDVHWKMSAREENLQIIRYASTKSKCNCVLCDTGDYFEKENEPYLDAVLETTLGLCKSFIAEGDSLLLAWRSGKELVGVTATLEDAVTSLCKSGYITDVHLRIDPFLVAEADSVTFVTACIDKHTADQISAIQNECPNVKGVFIKLCTAAGYAARKDTDICEKLMSAGVIIEE